MPNFIHNTPLKALNTFGIEAKAKLFVEVSTLTELKEVISSDAFSSNKTLVLGGGSNILLKNDFDGLVIKNNLKGIQTISETETEINLKVGSGEVWHELVLFCVANGYGGVENMSLIPGTVGAAPMQNIGAYGTEIKDVFISLEALNITTGQVTVFDNETCQFGYRESIFKHEQKGKYIICSVSLKLQKNAKVNIAYGAIKETLKAMGLTEPTIKNVSDAVISIRKSKLPDPAEIGNSGSFFKNPIISLTAFETLKKKFPEVPSYPVDDTSVKIPAGWLIDQDGWKGKTFGNIGVHKNQALVLVNYGGGKGAEIEALSKKIQTSVFEKYGINLHAEVNII